MAFTKVVGAGIHTLAQLQTHNIHSAGIITATTFVGNIGGNPTFSGDATFSGNVSIGGTLTYEDVTNIDSIGIITARAGINVSGGTITGDGSGLTGLPAGAPVGGASTNTVFFENDNSVDVSYTISTDKNAMAAGPIAIKSGVTVTVPSGSFLTIV